MQLAHYARNALLKHKNDFVAAPNQVLTGPICHITTQSQLAKHGALPYQFTCDARRVPMKAKRENKTMKNTEASQ